MPYHARNEHLGSALARRCQCAHVPITRRRRRCWLRTSSTTVPAHPSSLTVSPRSQLPLHGHHPDPRAFRPIAPVIKAEVRVRPKRLGADAFSNRADILDIFLHHVSRGRFYLCAWTIRITASASSSWNPLRAGSYCQSNQNTIHNY
jgi:hypothetical protein